MHQSLRPTGWRWSEFSPLSRPTVWNSGLPDLPALGLRVQLRTNPALIVGVRSNKRLGMLIVSSPEAHFPTAKTDHYAMPFPTPSGTNTAWLLLNTDSWDWAKVLFHLLHCSLPSCLSRLSPLSQKHSLISTVSAHYNNSTPHKISPQRKLLTQHKKDWRQITEGSFHLQSILSGREWLEVFKTREYWGSQSCWAV